MGHVRLVDRGGAALQAPVTIPATKAAMRRTLLASLLALASFGCWNREAMWEAVDDDARASSARKGESEAEALYRHGKSCMDVLERDDCAIDYFEQLVALSPGDRRDLLGDATFRLVELYRRNGQADAATLLLRKFWELGMDMGSAGVVPYGVRFAPPTLTTLFQVDVARLEASGLHGKLPSEAKELMFTCDDARREQLEAEVAARREARRAEREAANPPTPAEQRQAEQRKQRRDARRKADEGKPDPIYGEGFCQLARALGLADPSDFDRFLGASHHDDARQSIAVIEVAELDTKLAAAVTAGTLALEPEQAIAGRERSTMTQSMRDKLRMWTLVGVEYEGEPVRVLSLDRNELMLAPAKLAPDILHARAHAQERLDPKLRALLEQVPGEVAFLTVIEAEAMQEALGEFGAMGKLLPDPQGMLVAAVVHDYAGLFVRLPTEEAVKAYLLLAIVRKLLDDQQAEQAEDEASPLRELDITQSPDGKALLMSSILSERTVEQMFLGG